MKKTDQSPRLAAARTARSRCLRAGLVLLLAVGLTGCGLARTAVKAPVNATAAVVNTVL